MWVLKTFAGVCPPPHRHRAAPSPPESFMQPVCDLTLLPTPVPGNHWSAFCSDNFAFSETSRKWDHTARHLLHLAPFPLRRAPRVTCDAAYSGGSFLFIVFSPKEISSLNRKQQWPCAFYVLWQCSHQCSRTVTAWEVTVNREPKTSVMSTWTSDRGHRYIWARHCSPCTTWLFPRLPVMIDLKPDGNFNS